MRDRMMQKKLFAMTEHNHLRLEAIQLYENCLTQGDLTMMIDFVERQIVHDPPRLQLLRDIAEDLQQRLLSLREYHFDVRERVVSTLEDSFQVNIASLAPQAELDRYHHLSPDDILDVVQQHNPTLEKKDLLLIRKMVDASLQMAGQFHNDIQLTTQLYHLVLDWTEAMSVTVARQYWPDNTFSSPEEQDNRTEH